VSAEPGAEPEPGEMGTGAASELAMANPLKLLISSMKIMVMPINLPANLHFRRNMDVYLLWDRSDLAPLIDGTRRLNLVEIEYRSCVNPGFDSE
jgi:hypothetical protein